jgi:hypothetical protein
LAVLRSRSGSLLYLSWLECTEKDVACCTSFGWNAQRKVLPAVPIVDGMHRKDVACCTSLGWNAEKKMLLSCLKTNVLSSEC